MAETLETKPNISAPAASLRQALRGFIKAHQTLYSLAERRIKAVTTADLIALRSILSEESAAVQQIVQHEKTRAAAVTELATTLCLGNPDSLTATAIASSIGTDIGRELAEDAEELRNIIEQLQRRNESARLATQHLASHMEGLLRGAEQALSHTGVYSSRGAVAAGTPVVTAMDITT